MSQPSSVKFVITEEELEELRVEQDPRQLRLAVAATSIAPQAGHQQAATPSTSSEVAGTAYRTQALRQIPSAQLGPADPTQGQGRPKGSKSRPRVALTYGTSAPPKWAEAAKARAKKTPKK